MDIFSSDQLTQLIPLATNWVLQQERQILENGVPLSEDQEIDAFLVGVKNIKKVRLMKVDKIPQPLIAGLKEAAEMTGFLSSETIGVSFRYGIYIKSEYWGLRKLIVHELTHTMQYERLGGVQNFLAQYLEECFILGYSNSPLEIEAKEMERKIVFNDSNN